MSLQSPLSASELAAHLLEHVPALLELEERNDATVISAQMSSDELVSNEDIEHTHQVILAGRAEAVTFDLWEIVRRGAINLVLPFINGVMLGFGEIFAHEIGFKYGFVGARVYPPRRKSKFI